LKKKLLSVAVPFLAPLIFLTLWAIIARRIDNHVILPGIGQVTDILMHPGRDLISMGSIAGNSLVSLARVVLGYVTAAVLAIPLGVIPVFQRVPEPVQTHPAPGLGAACHGMVRDFKPCNHFGSGNRPALCLPQQYQILHAVHYFYRWVLSHTDFDHSRRAPGEQNAHRFCKGPGGE
jgi:hypothetical protein